MRSIVLANQKGGVGKTTTAVHLAHGLALAGHRAALIDLDPQGNSTLALQGMEVAASDGDTGDELDTLDALQDGLWILPSPGAQRNVAADAFPDLGRLRGLADRMDAAGFEWMIVDGPPRMDAWGIASIRLCEQVLVPVQAEFFAMHGLAQMIATLDQLRRRHPGCADVLGIVVTMFDPDSRIEREILADLLEHFGPKLFATTVERDTQIVEAASHGLTVFDYNTGAVGARGYGELVREILYGRT